MYKNYVVVMGLCLDSVKECWYVVLEKVYLDYVVGVWNVVESLDIDVNMVLIIENIFIEDS